MRTQAEKGGAFRSLHQRPNAFLIPNPWDTGSTRLLAHLGFEALATTSAGHAFSLGQPDGTVGCDQVMAHLAAIAAATDLPVSGDLGNGFGDRPETVAETIRLAAAEGVAGGSIEDSTGRPDDPLYAREHAAERVRAAAEAARALPVPFVLTGRAESFLVGQPHLGDTIRRLQSYQEAGAEVLYAPGLTSEADIAAVVSSVDRPGTGRRSPEPREPVGPRRQAHQRRQRAVSCFVRRSPPGRTRDARARHLRLRGGGRGLSGSQRAVRGAYPVTANRTLI